MPTPTGQAERCHRELLGLLAGCGPTPSSVSDEDELVIGGTLNPAI